MKITNPLAALTAETVFAHCDVPCGIYDPKMAQIYAAGAVKMLEKINNELQFASDLHTTHDLIRLVLVKEDQAQRCKEELSILWSDYFKPEHLAAHPDLHDIFWRALKACSAVKRGTSLDDAKTLTDLVDQIAEIFAATKSAPAAH